MMPVCKVRLILAKIVFLDHRGNHSSCFFMVKDVSLLDIDRTVTHYAPFMSKAGA